MYLGLPEKICGSKMKAFSFVQDRFNGCVNLWSARVISKSGKGVKIKAVDQVVPAYMISVKLP